jgi:hypothetical protein
MSEVCEILTEVLHRRVVYEPVTDAQARTGLIANGIDPWYADHMIGVFSLFRQFDAGRTTDVVERADRAARDSAGRGLPPPPSGAHDLPSEPS